MPLNISKSKSVYWKILFNKKHFLHFQTYPEWKQHKQLMLSSFFWGYICLQVLAGQLGKKFGAKYPLLFVMIISSVITIFIPLLGDQFGWKGVIACRILQGLTQGFLIPSCHTVLSCWAPLSERTKFGAIVYAGNTDVIHF